MSIKNTLLVKRMYIRVPIICLSLELTSRGCHKKFYTLMKEPIILFLHQRLMLNAYFFHMYNTEIPLTLTRKDGQLVFTLSLSITAVYRILQIYKLEPHIVLKRKYVCFLIIATAR